MAVPPRSRKGRPHRPRINACINARIDAPITAPLTHYAGFTYKKIVAPAVLAARIL
jgi:hypothetical protein